MRDALPPADVLLGPEGAPLWDAEAACSQARGNTKTRDREEPRAGAGTHGGLSREDMGDTRAREGNTQLNHVRTARGRRRPCARGGRTRPFLGRARRPRRQGRPRPGVPQTEAGRGRGRARGPLALTAAAPDHLLSRPDGAQDGFLQTSLHVQRLLEREAVDALEGLFPLGGQRAGSGLPLPSSGGPHPSGPFWPPDSRAWRHSSPHD